MTVPDSKLRMSGRFQHCANVGTNSLEIEYRGPNKIDFSDGTSITVYQPIFKTNGTMWGERVGWFSGKLCIEYPDHNIKAYVNMGKGPKEGKFSGKNRKDTLSG